MNIIGTFEAKTHLTALLARVAKGEKILITNRSKPMAMLIPATEGDDGDDDIASLVASLLSSRDNEGPSLGNKLTLRQLIEEGRKN